MRFDNRNSRLPRLPFLHDSLRRHVTTELDLSHTHGTHVDRLQRLIGAKLPIDPVLLLFFLPVGLILPINTPANLLSQKHKADKVVVQAFVRTYIAESFQDGWGLCQGRRDAALRARDVRLRRRRRLHQRLAPGQGHLVRPAQRRRTRRQRRCVRVQEHQPVPVHVHDLLRQRASVPGWQGLWRLLPDTVHQQPVVLRPTQDGDHHRHELLPRCQVPLRPERHGVRRHGEAGAERPAPPRRHHRHPVQACPVLPPRPLRQLPRRGRVQPGVPRRAGGVRQQGRHGGAARRHGVAPRRQADEGVDADAPLLGIHLAARRQPPSPGPLLPPHGERVRPDRHRQAGHPGELEGQHQLRLQSPVPLICLPLCMPSSLCRRPRTNFDSIDRH